MTGLAIALSGASGLHGTSVAMVLGLLALALVALPVCRRWRALLPNRNPGANAEMPASPTYRPSVLYCAGVWRLGQFAVGLLPQRFSDILGALISGIYFALQPRRRSIVIENMLPIVGGDLSAAKAASRRLFRKFGSKVVGLLRHEAGAPIDYSMMDWSGGEILLNAKAKGHGVLMVTVHLGDWEIGGAQVANLGVKLVVLSQAEPGNGFTAMRQSSRARWGIETIVVGSDAFAFVDVIKRLQCGEVVALLIDRPPPSSSATVTLFGRPFRASISAAELARVTGCTLLPVYVVRGSHGFCAHVLPEVHYDRRALGTREARVVLTQEIMRAFEPAIRQYCDQWYHFVPIWPHGE